MNDTRDKAFFLNHYYLSILQEKRLFLMNFVFTKYFAPVLKILHCNSLVISLSIIPVIERMTRVHFVREMVVINSARFSGIYTRKVH